MTAEEIYIRLRDELTAENESSSSPERIFIKNEGQTICTIGMNRSHEIIFVEFKPAPKDLAVIEREAFVHPHPVEMLHDAGWRQAQLTSWEEAEKLLEIIQRSYKRKKPKAEEVTGLGKRRKRRREAVVAAPPEKPAVAKRKAVAKKPARQVKKIAGPKPRPQAKPKAKAKAKARVKPRPAASKKKSAKKKRR